MIAGPAWVLSGLPSFAQIIDQITVGIEDTYGWDLAHKHLLLSTGLTYQAFRRKN
jgi:hypothetical protein